jgi:tetratricopeptide (TPR) repeat protein
MIKTILFVSILLLFSACSLKEQNAVKPAKKAFAQEDFYILVALDAQQHANYKVAAELFDLLYEKSQKREYLYAALQNRLLLKEYEKVVAKVDDFLRHTVKDAELIRLKVVALSHLKRFQEALTLALELAALTKDPHDYILVSNLYAQEKKYDLALKYLEGAYVKEYNEEILDKMAVILYVNLGRKKDAIAQLESHARIHSCSKRICMRLISFYSDTNNIDGLLSVYKRLYAKYKQDDIARKIIQIYKYKREYFKLIDFLEENGIDDVLLLDMYASVKDYDKASKIAQKLYEETSDISYLGQSALYAYEAKGKKISKKQLHDIIKKLQKVVQKRENEAMYLNYLGYILIDHEIDVKKGMEYVKKALKLEPNSAYYIDSLAWGYYKLGACKQADALIKKVLVLGEGDEPEVKEHIKMIEQCIKNSKKGKK